MKTGQKNIIEIKSRVEIVDVVSQYISLRKVGSSLMGLCPFHSEKTPSFNVNPARQFFHCFGCGESGDIFDFVQKIEKIDFPQALSKLAFRAGVKLEKMSEEDTREAEKTLRKEQHLFRINKLACSFFTENVKKYHNIVTQFASARGLSNETIDLFNIGFAPESWNALTLFLHQKGVQLELARDLGLIRHKSKVPAGSQRSTDFYDGFRNRIVFPIFDISNHILGFSARRIDHIAENDEKTPKYINSPESLIYRKREGLFGINLASRYINSEDSVIVVEGNLDCIALAAAGFRNVVATLGTALTQLHVEKLRRLTRNIVLVFDGDRAGCAATRKAFELFSSANVSSVKTLPLPPGYDPDSFIREHGAENFKNLLTKSRYLIEYLLEKELSRVPDPGPTDRVRIYRKCDEYIKKIPDSLSRQSYYKYLQKSLGLKDRTKVNSRTTPHHAFPSVKKAASFRGDRAEETLLRIILNYPIVNAPSFKTILSNGIFSRFSTQEYMLLGHEFLKAFSSLTFDSTNDAKTASDPDSFEKSNNLKTDSEIQATPGNYHRVITDLMIRNLDSQDLSTLKPVLINLLLKVPEVNEEMLDAILSDCIQKISEKNQQKTVTHLLEKIRKAEHASDSKSQLEALEEYQNLIRKQNAVSKEA